MVDRMIRDLFEMFIVMTMALLLISIPAAIGITLLDKHQCSKYAETTGRDTKYVFLDHCYVHSKGRWLTQDEYQAVITAKDGLSK